MESQTEIQGGSSVTLLSLQDADVYIQKILKDLIGDLQGKTVAGTADLRFVSDKEFEERLETSEPPKTTQDRIRLKLTMGFVQEDTGSKIVWIRESQKSGTVLVHEAIHVYAHPNWKIWRRKNSWGQALDEGTTEYFTLKISKVLGLKGLKAYTNWVLAIEQLVALTSEELLASAYFSGNIEAWEIGLGKVLGNDLYPWLGLVQDENVEQARLLFPVSTTNNNNNSSPSTSVGTSGNKVSLQDRMRDHMRSLIQAVAEETKPEPKDIKSWDPLVAGAGQAAHSTYRGTCGSYAVLGASQYFVRLLEPSAGSGKSVSDEEEAIVELVKATSVKLVARAFLLGEIGNLEKAHPMVGEWIYHMNRQAGTGVFTASTVFGSLYSTDY